MRVLLEGAGYLTGHFLALGDDDLCLEIGTPSPWRPPPESRMACVTFQHRGQGLMFVSTSRPLQRATPPHTLLLGRPRRLDPVDPSILRRVPVPCDLNLVVMLEAGHGSKARLALPIDLSMTGIGVELLDGAPPELDEALVRVVLVHRGERFDLGAEILHRAGRRLGMAFVQPVPAHTSARLRTLVDEVEFTWLHEIFEAPGPLRLA